MISPMIPYTPNVPVKKSAEVLELYQEFGPKFNKVLFSLYLDIQEGLCTNLEKQFMQLCQEHMSINPKSPLEIYQVFPFWCQQNYLGKQFDHAICVSVNNEVAHGSPDDKEIKQGDIVSVDCGVGIPLHNHFVYLDAAFTVTVGQENEWVKAPLYALQDIRINNPKNTMTIADHISVAARRADLQQVVALTGHGIGFHLHEPPVIYNAPGNFISVELFDGLCFCAEPIFTKNNYKYSPPITPVYIGEDGWTVLTNDNSLASHFETTFGVINGQIIDLIGVSTWDI